MNCIVEHQTANCPECGKDTYISDYEFHFIGGTCPHCKKKIEKR